VSEHVVICGGGVAALEAAGALREHAGDRVTLTLVAPDKEFVYRPLAPASAFGYPDPPRVPLHQIADRVGATLIADRVAWIDRAEGIVHTAAGAGADYDALIVCVGAGARVVYEHALSIDGRATSELDALIAEIRTGEVQRLAFVAHGRPSWTLPLYEAALMSATVAAEAGHALQLTIVTTEPRPLAVFGEQASREMEELLSELGFGGLVVAGCVRGAGAVIQGRRRAGQVGIGGQRAHMVAVRGEQHQWFIHPDHVTAVPAAHRRGMAQGAHGEAESGSLSWSAHAGSGR
jgi:sulfide:quinone oxidoreductase